MKTGAAFAAKMRKPEAMLLREHLHRVAMAIAAMAQNPGRVPELSRTAFAALREASVLITAAETGDQRRKTG